MLAHWRTCVMHSKAESMKEVASSATAWKTLPPGRRPATFRRLSTLKTAVFLIAAKLSFQASNPHTSVIYLKFNRV
jgi:hypothetical protein